MSDARNRTIHVSSTRQLQLREVDAELVSYRGRRAVRLLESDQAQGEEQTLAILPGLEFRDGTIETAVAASPRAGAPDFARGFAGIAFRVRPDASQFEVFFIRPTNGRSEDQLRRNHSTQYMSHPDYPWFRLREESPGVYESYVDLIPAAWTPIRIIVAGVKAALYVNRASQPALLVNDLKLGSSQGQLALWIGAGTEAYFSTKLTVYGAA
jgi:hypothetical protein